MRGRKVIPILMSVVLCGTLFLNQRCDVRAEEDTTASTIRLAKSEGTIKVTKGKKSQSVSKGTRLPSGCSIVTEEKSYAWLNLDDTKALKLDEKTDVLITKNGENLDVTLNEGKIFVDVSQKLKPTENYHIRTADSIMGIRGTIVEAERDNRIQRTRITMLEGNSGWQEVFAEGNGSNGTSGAAATQQRDAGRFIALAAGSTLIISAATNAGAANNASAGVAERAGATLATHQIQVRRTTTADVSGFAQVEIAGGNEADAGRERFSEGGGADVLSRRIYNATNGALDLRGETLQQANEVLREDQAVNSLNGTAFDADEYARRNGDVVAKVGTGRDALWQHYVQFGQDENRVTSQEQEQQKQQEQQEKAKTYEAFHQEQEKLIEEERLAQTPPDTGDSGDGWTYYEMDGMQMRTNGSVTQMYNPDTGQWMSEW
ncbi:MAG: FecR family protein [Lachnospiraceae bacterium]|nr:FecR family protein [Lachnospiraceae bacterium]